MCIPYFAHSSVDGHLGYCHLLVIVKDAAMNTGAPIFVFIEVYFTYNKMHGY